MTPSHVYLALLFVLGGVCLGGCAGAVPYRAPVKPPTTALLFIDIKAPLTTNHNGTACGANVKKVSRSSTSYFRDFLITGQDFAWDDAGLEQIAKAGGLDSIAFADYEYMNVLGVYGKFTVNVYGN